MKKVLIVSYSQTGQLSRAARCMTGPLEEDENIHVTHEVVRPRADYPFPWPYLRFLDAFPETVALEPPTLEPFGFDAERQYDLVIVAYTVWFLSPSPPITGFLKSEAGRRVLRDTPVITLVTCRNMWIMAQEKVKALLSAAGARLIDNIVLTDSGRALATFITTPRWMLTGRKDSLWGVFPAAGVADETIRRTARFGHAIARAFGDGTLDGRQSVLGGLGAVAVDDRLIASERIGERSFAFWGWLARRAGGPGSRRRLPVLLTYACVLSAMIITIVPVSMALRALLRPLMRTRLARQRAYFELPSGAGRQRMEQPS